MSWRAGIEQNARVSSIMPEIRLKPAISVTDCLNRMIDSGASMNHHGTPMYSER